MDQSRYTKSIVIRLLEATDMKKNIMSYGSILPTSIIPTYIEITTTPKDSTQMQ
jgi:hypothetical protein